MNDNETKLQPYAVTLEYHETCYLVVPVEAGSVEDAIALALQTDHWDAQRTYDQVGDIYVGHIGLHETVESAERASCREGDGLSIPFKFQEDSEQLEDVKGVAGVMLAALVMADERIAADGYSLDTIVRRAVRDAIARAEALGIPPAVGNGGADRSPSGR